MKTIRIEGRRWVVESLESRHCLSTIGFAQHEIYGHQLGGSEAMITADLDGDGDQDFISGNISWRANDGQGNFGETQLVTTQLSRVDTLLAGDLDGDGDNDIVSASNDELAWFENRDGRGRFGPKQSIASVDYTASLASGDLDGDGDLDLVRLGFKSIGSRRYTLEWLENIGSSGPFERRQLSNEATFSIDVVDLDHDGDQDILSGYAWFENTDGEGQFVERPDLLETEAARIAIADVDNNGRLDVIALDELPWEIVWYEATADDPATFRRRQDVSGDRFELLFDGASAYLGDVDGDGDRDLVVAFYDGIAGTSSFQFYELVGGQYVYGGGITKGSTLVLTDLNGDLREDALIYAPDDRSTFWRPYQGENRGFGPPVPLTDNLLSTSAFAVADIDGDQDFDLIHANVDWGCYGFPCHASISWSENLDGSSEFGPRRLIQAEEPIGEVFNEVWPTDIDGDGDVDILLKKPSGMAWFENVDARGSFSAEHLIPETEEVRLVGDLDNDGDLDLLSVFDDTGEMRWHWYDVPQGQWISSSIDLQWPIGRWGQLLIGDVDSDGDLDLLFSGLHSTANITVVSVWLEHVDGRVAFAPERDMLPDVPIETLAEIWPTFETLADVDRDGDLDVVHRVNRDDERVLAWLENKGRGNFEPGREIEPVHFPTRIKPVDLDSDGDVDLMAGLGGDLVWYENLDGQGSYGAARHITSSQGQYAFGDLDGDGDVDILGGKRGVGWLENRAVGDVNGDRRFDSSDLVQVLAAGKYEDDVPGNTEFIAGDWNGDGDFTTADLVEAFAAGRFVPDVRATLASGRP